jgi:23S rRNA (uracil1939-C5)-methyltransferase
MTIHSGDLVDLQITDMACGGKAIAKLDRFVVFVDRGVPGDKIRARITKRKKSFAEARALEILQPSSIRVEPRCSHFGVCGGCRWQDIPYPLQLKFKAQHLQDNLRRLGGFVEPPVAEVIGSEKIYFYRNKMEFSFHPDQSCELLLGLHRSGSYDQIFDLKQCFLQSELSNRIVEFVRAEAKKLDLPAYHASEHTGFLRFLTLRQGNNTGELMVNLVTSAESHDRLDDFYDSLKREFPQITSLMQNVNPTRANIATGLFERHICGQRSITERIEPYTFEISANSFFQTNTGQAAKLFSTAVEFCDFKGKEKVLDLYSGTGSLSIFASRYVDSVTGIEISDSAIDDANRNCEINGVQNCSFVQGDAIKVLGKLSTSGDKFDLVIADPPRAGLHPRIVKYLLQELPSKIVYVSCNPATLSRDSKLLCQTSYELKKLQPIDMFPHTSHIETVAALTKR